MDPQKKKNVMVASLAIVGIGCGGYWLMPSDASDTHQRTPGDTVVTRRPVDPPSDSNAATIRKPQPPREQPRTIRRPVRPLAQPNPPIRKQPKDRTRTKTPAKQAFPAG